MDSIELYRFINNFLLLNYQFKIFYDFQIVRKKTSPAQNKPVTEILQIPKHVEGFIRYDMKLRKYKPIHIVKNNVFAEFNLPEKIPLKMGYSNKLYL